MDTLFFHQVVANIQASLARAGVTGFALWRVEDARKWFYLPWLFAFLERLRPTRIPLSWDGAGLPTFESRFIELDRRRRKVWRTSREGEVFVTGDALIAVVGLMSGYGDPETVVIAGERRDGAFQRFLDVYGRYDHRATRRSRKIEVVGEDPIPRPTGLAWEDVILPASLGKEVRLQVESFFAAGELYRKMGIPYRRGLLFTGPPGNGKTSIIRVIACRRREPFIWLTAHPGDDDDKLDRAIDRALLVAPSILCLEDVDSLLKKDGSLSHFLNRLDGLAPMEGVLIIATTNHPEELDEAVTNRPSRFDRIFFFDNPAAAERRTFLQPRFGARFDEKLVARTEGLSFAQIKEVWVSACLEALHSGGTEPTFDAALRAIARLAGQKSVKDSNWQPVRAVGFQRPNLVRPGDRPLPPLNS